MKHYFGEGGVLLLLMYLSFLGCNADSASSPSTADGGLVGNIDASSPRTDAAGIEMDARLSIMDSALPPGDAGPMPDDMGTTATDSERAQPDTNASDMGAGVLACDEACTGVAQCLVEQCPGFGGGLRRIIYNRCVNLCSPELAMQLDGLSCEETVEVASGLIPQVEPACRRPEPGDGINALYIGHSFGRSFAARLPQWAEAIGVDNHVQSIVFRGGESGAPQALWANQATRTEIQGILDQGQTNLLILICCSEQFRVDGTDPAIRQWIDYALAQNPNTRIALALPWPDFPQDYPSGDEYAALFNGGLLLWHRLINRLRVDYPGVDIFCIPHGRAALELRTLYEADRLPDVDAMIRGDGEVGIFTDQKGHAANILLDVGTLVWLGAIYGVDVSNYPLDREYATDLPGLAELILSEDEYAR